MSFSRLCATMIVFLLLGLTVQHANSLRNPMKTTRQCFSPKQVPLPTLEERIKREEKCRQFCFKDLMDNKLLFKGMKSGRKFDQIDTFDQFYLTTDFDCCCLYQNQWPTFVRPQLIGRELPGTHNKKVRPSKKITQCLPIVIGFKLTPRTVKSYREMCDYLQRPTPLTTLELVRFMDVAAYINYIAPKHPAIAATITSNKNVASIDLSAVKRVKETIYAEMVDDNFSLSDYSGYEVRNRHLVKLNKLMDGTAEVRKSPLVASAVDEFILSEVVMDIAATAMGLAVEWNDKKLHIPKHLLEGHYDEYDTMGKLKYFVIPSFNCAELSKILRRLEAYLRTTTSLLGRLYEKLTYEHMLQQYDGLRYLKQSNQIYEYIWQANCQK